MPATPAYRPEEILTHESTRSARLKWVVGALNTALEPGRLANAVACVAAATGEAVRGLQGPGGEPVRGPHHRHLAVPARAGQERHDHALPRGQAGLEDAGVPARRPAPGLEGTQGVVVFHEQVLEIVAEFDRGHPRRGRRGAPRARRRRGHGRDRGVVASRARWRRGYAAAGRRADLGGAQGVRVVRVLQGPRRGVRAADLPVGLAQGAPPGAFLAGVLTHDPGMYPKRLILDDARQFGIAVLGLDVNASRGDLRRRAGRRPYDEPPPDGARGRPPRRRTPGPGPARRPGLRHPAVPGRRQGHQRGRGRADRAPAGPTHSLADFWHRARVSRPVVERLVLAGGFDALYGIGARRAGAARPPRPGHPARPAAPGRRARPARPAVDRAAGRGWRRRRDRPVGRASPAAAAACRSEHATAARAPRRRATAGGGVWARPPPQSQATAAVPAPVALGPARPSTSATAPARRRGHRAAGDDRPGAGARRARDPRPRRQPRTSSTSTPPFLDALGVTRSRDLLAPAQPGRAAGRRGQGRHPDPADPVRAPGRLPDPRRRHRAGRRDLLRGRPGPLRRDRLPLLAAAGPRGAAPHRRRGASRCGPPAPGSSPRCGTPGTLRRACDRRVREAARRRPTARRGSGAAARAERRPDGAGSAARRTTGSRAWAARVLVHARGFRQSPYADIKPAGDDVKARASSPARARRARQPGPASLRCPPRKLWHASPGSSGH